MNNITETRFPYTKRSIEYSDYDTVIYQKKSLLGYSYDVIPLVQFAPEVIIYKKKLSTVAKCLLILEVVIVAAFYFAYFTLPELEQIIDINPATVLLGLIALISGIYYHYASETLLIFTDLNHEHAFMSLLYDKEDQAQKEYILNFEHAVRNARVNVDQRNLSRLQHGVESLCKQQIISRNFADTLQGRIAQVMGKVI